MGLDILGVPLAVELTFVGLVEERERRYILARDLIKHIKSLEFVEITEPLLSKTNVLLEYELVADRVKRGS
jgi:hypothetical protein